VVILEDTSQHAVQALTAIEELIEASRAHCSSRKKRSKMFGGKFVLFAERVAVTHVKIEGKKCSTRVGPFVWYGEQSHTHERKHFLRPSKKAWREKKILK